MTYVWVAALIIAFLVGFIRRHITMRRQIREAILKETLKQEGPEAMRAMEARLNGEWR